MQAVHSEGVNNEFMTISIMVLTTAMLVLSPKAVFHSIAHLLFPNAVSGLAAEYSILRLAVICVKSNSTTKSVKVLLGYDSLRLVKSKTKRGPCLHSGKDPHV